MKSDTERRRYHKAKNHQKTKRMNVHLSKDLRAKLKRKRRSLLVRKGDKVRLMRGPEKGKTAKVARVSHARMKVYLEGMTVRNSRGREVMRVFQPSNLELIELGQTKERKELFTEAAFRKEEKKPEKKPTAKVEGPPTIEAEVLPEEPKKEEKPEGAPKPETEEKPAEKKEEPKTTKPETPKPETKTEKPKDVGVK